MKLTRRSLLKNVSLGSGAVLLAPTLAALDAEAAGEARLPRRFVFMLQTQGLQSWAVKPAEIDRPRDGVQQLVDRSLAGLSLPEGLAPLEPFRDRLTIVQGLNGRHVFPYHGGPFGALGGFLKGRTPEGRTIDAALAEAHPAIFPLLSLGIGSYANAEYCCSAWGENKAAPTICNPDYAYNTLFGSALQGADRTDFDSRASLLDFLKDDVKRVQSAQ